MHYLRPRGWPDGYGEQGERVAPVPARGLQILPGLLEPHWDGAALDRQVCPSHSRAQPHSPRGGRGSLSGKLTVAPDRDSDDVNDAITRDFGMNGDPAATCPSGQTAAHSTLDEF